MMSPEIMRAITMRPGQIIGIIIMLILMAAAIVMSKKPMVTEFPLQKTPEALAIILKPKCQQVLKCEAAIEEHAAECFNADIDFRFTVFGAGGADPAKAALCVNEKSDHIYFKVGRIEGA